MTEGKLYAAKNLAIGKVAPEIVGVNVDGEEVLLNCWDFHRDWFDWWISTSAGDMSYMLGNMLMTVGDWIELKRLR